MTEEQRITTAFNNRLAIYREKRDRADPFAADGYSHQEVLQYVIDAIELLAVEAGLASVDLESKTND